MTSVANAIHAAEAAQMRKIRIGQWIALGVLAMYVLIGVLILMRESVFLPIITGAVTLSFAPITAVFYIRDVRRGVFKPTPEEEAGYAEMLKKNAEEKAAKHK